MAVAIRQGPASRAKRRSRIGCSRLRHAWVVWWASDNAVTAASMPPLAPMQWPVSDFVAATRGVVPKSRSMTDDSISSLTAVPVPCALT
jgi:hypothetical protein